MPDPVDGAGVVTTRFDVHYVVTEFGAVDLYGKTMQDRAKAMISIAAPEHQEALDKAAFEDSEAISISAANKIKSLVTGKFPVTKGLSPQQPNLKRRKIYDGLE